MILTEDELKSDPAERPKSVNTEQEQTISDDELFDKAKVNPKKLDRYTISKLIEACIVFGEMLCNFKLYKYERKLAERVILSLMMNDGATISALLARQSGKSETLGLVIPSVSILLPLFAEYLSAAGIKSHLIKYIRGFWCGIYAPDYERSSIIGKKINRNLASQGSKQILSEPEIGMQFPNKLSSFLGKLPRNSFIRVKSANKKVSIEGDTYHLVVTDETQEINDHVIKKSIHPFLAATNGTMVHLGSTYYNRVYFYDVIKVNKEDDTKRTEKQRCHFEYDYHEVQKYNKNYKKYIEKQKRILGEYSDEFRMSYELYWPLELGMFITEEFLVNNIGKNYSVTNYDKTNMHSIGIDIGKVIDSTIITVLDVDYQTPIVLDPESRLIRHSKKIKNWFEIHGEDYDKQFYQICSFIDNYRWNNLVIDATGVGAGLYDRLKNKYGRDSGKNVIPFVFSLQSKSAGYDLLQSELLGERIQFPNSPKTQALRKHKSFITQFINLAKRVKNGYLVVEHSEEKGFDDYPDSLMLATFGAEGTSVSNQIEEVEVDIFRNSNQSIFRQDAGLNIGINNRRMKNGFIN